MPEPEERYVVVDLALLEAIRQLADLQREVHVILRVAHVARMEGRIVFGARMVRELGQGSEGA